MTKSKKKGKANFFRFPVPQGASKKRSGRGGRGRGGGGGGGGNGGGNSRKTAAKAIRRACVAGEVDKLLASKLLGDALAGDDKTTAQVLALLIKHGKLSHAASLLFSPHVSVGIGQLVGALLQMPQLVPIDQDAAVELLRQAVAGRSAVVETQAAGILLEFLSEAEASRSLPRHIRDSFRDSFRDSSERLLRLGEPRCHQRISPIPPTRTSSSRRAATPSPPPPCPPSSALAAPPSPSASRQARRAALGAAKHQSSPTRPLTKQAPSRPRCGSSAIAPPRRRATGSSDARLQAVLWHARATRPRHVPVGSSGASSPETDRGDTSETLPRHFRRQQRGLLSGDCVALTPLQQRAGGGGGGGGGMPPPPPQLSSAPSALPAGWVEYFAPGGGAPYYHHAPSGRCEQRLFTPPAVNRRRTTTTRRRAGVNSVSSHLQL